MPPNKWRTAIAEFMANKITREELGQIDKEGDEDPSKLPTIAISTLSTEAVQKMLNLKLAFNDHELADVEPLAIPPPLVRDLSVVNDATGQSPSCEANFRFTLNALLFNAHQIAMRDQAHGSHPVHIQAERQWGYGPVTWESCAWYLTGRPDYGVWYGAQEEISVNVIVVEAKGPEKVWTGIPQALAYMGCVHRRRKDLMKEDCTVYGLVANESCFWFLKISNDSYWSERVILARGRNIKSYEQALGLLVYYFRKAAIVSPANSREGSVQTNRRISFNVDTEVLEMSSDV